MSAPPRLSIVIPTWNGLDLLRIYLPSVLAELRRWETAAAATGEIVVSDDGSTDDTRAWLAAEAPRARVVRSEANRGFSYAANAGVEAARAEIAVLLNNDLELVPGALEAVLPDFDDPELFGITFRSLDLPRRSFATGGKLGNYRRGFWSAWRNYDWPDDPVDPRGDGAPALPTFMLVGGFCAFRRGRFLELGGFDPLFAPYYAEDLDLSYRARKRGWRIHYQPRVLVLHQRGASVERHQSPWRRNAVIERNRLLFHWRNLDRGRLAGHLAWAHLLLLSQALAGRFYYHAGYLQALRQTRRVWQYRRRERPHWRRRDRDLAVTAPAMRAPAEPRP